MREKKLNKHSSFETWHRVFFFCHTVVLPFSKIYCGLHVLYMGLCALCSWRNVDTQSSLGHFSFKKLFVIHQQLLGQVLCAKKKFSLFTPTKDKHFMDCCKQNLWIFIFFFLFETWHAFCTFFIDFSLSLIESYFLVIFSVPFIWRSVHNSTGTSNRIIVWWRFSSFLVKQRHQALFEYLRVSGISWKITIFSRITNWNTRKYINISPQYSRVEVIFCVIHRTLNLYTLMSNRYCLYIIVSIKPS